MLKIVSTLTEEVQRSLPQALVLLTKRHKQKVRVVTVALQTMIDVKALDEAQLDMVQSPGSAPSMISTMMSSSTQTTDVKM